MESVQNQNKKKTTKWREKKILFPDWTGYNNGNESKNQLTEFSP